MEKRKNGLELNLNQMETVRGGVNALGVYRPGFRYKRESLQFFRDCVGEDIYNKAIMAFLVGQMGLKNLFSRPCPCQIDHAFELLVTRPSSSSFPSTHSAWAFSAATAIFMRHKKLGALAHWVTARVRERFEKSKA